MTYRIITITDTEAERAALQLSDIVSRFLLKGWKLYGDHVITISTEKIVISQAIIKEKI